jgi:hypothetical protein
MYLEIRDDSTRYDQDSGLTFRGGDVALASLLWNDLHWVKVFETDQSVIFTRKH